MPQNEVDSAIKECIDKLFSDTLNAELKFASSDELRDEIKDKFFDGSPARCQAVLEATYKALMNWYPVDTLMSKEQRELFNAL